MASSCLKASLFLKNGAKICKKKVNKPGYLISKCLPGLAMLVTWGRVSNWGCMAAEGGVALWGFCNNVILGGGTEVFIIG